MCVCVSGSRLANRRLVLSPVPQTLTYGCCWLLNEFINKRCVAVLIHYTVTCTRCDSGCWIYSLDWRSHLHCTLCCAQLWLMYYFLGVVFVYTRYTKRWFECSYVHTNAINTHTVMVATVVQTKINVYMLHCIASQMLYGTKSRQILTACGRQAANGMRKLLRCWKCIGNRFGLVKLGARCVTWECRNR